MNWKPQRTFVRRRQRRAAGRVSAATATAVLAGLLSVSPVMADEAPDATVEPNSRTSRQQAVDIWATSGTEVKAAAEAALLGTDDDVIAFLADYADLRTQDYRVEAAQLASFGGENILAAVRKAVNGPEADLASFMKGGWKEPLQQDQRVLVARIVDVGGPQVQAQGRAALNGTDDDVQKFLEAGRTEAQEQDDRVLVAQLIAVGGTQVKSAGRLALTGTADDIREFLEVGQFIARSRDEEYATVAELAAQAERAGKLASAQTKAAQNASKEAVEASKQAKEAAVLAAKEAEATKQDSAAAANAANRAASAASGAAKAAQRAISAANAASQSARIASAAASQAAAAAVGAATAASSARNAAAAAATDAGKADAAKKAAVQARTAAAGATKAADAADQAVKAAVAAGQAALSAAGAEANAAAAADAAILAGEASAAAARSTAHAKAATDAANVASKAVEQAGNVYTLTRQIEAEELLGRTNAGIANARDLTAQAQAEATTRADRAKAAAEARRTADDLAVKARQGASDTEIARLGRELALADLKSGKPWLRAAAQNTLGAQADGVVDYVRTGRAEAQAQDDRADVERLAEESAVKEVRDAAEQALDGGDAAVSAFLTTGQYAAGREAFRIAVAQAADTGGPVVKERARAALQDDTTQVYRTFLTSTLTEAQEEDDRVRAAQLAESGTAEVKAAARIALESPAPQLRQFIESGQYTAQRKDLLALTHQQQVLQLVAEASQVAAIAQKDAATANATAATARRADTEAQQWAAKARQSATQAAGYATEADQHAKDAESSAKQAAASARTARAAADRANQSARQAAVSASDATVSSELAQNSASVAWAHANAARAAEERAKKSEAEAKAAAKDALVITIAKYREEEEERRRAAVAQKEAREKQGASAAELYRCGFLGCEAQENPGRWCQHHEAYCDVLAQAPLVKAFADGIEQFDKTILGLGELENCVSKRDLYSCWELQRDVLMSSKLRALSIAYDKLRQLTRGCTQCFLPGTRVLMADGGSKPIEQVQAGDLVYATDPVTKESGARTVAQQIVTHDDKYLSAVTIRGPTGERADITATYDHPFWSVNLQAWVAASKLWAGDTLRTDSGATATVLGNRLYEREATTYSLTVAGLHSFYVLAGDTPVLVHNSECKVLVLGLSKHLDDEIKNVPGGYHLMAKELEEVIGTLPGGIPYTKWMKGVNDALSGNQKVAVSLRGLKGGTYQEKFDAAVKAGQGKNWGATEWEMGRIEFYYRTGDLDWKNVTFYGEDGKRLATGEIMPPKPPEKK